MEKQPLFWLGPFPLDGKDIFPTFPLVYGQKSANIMRLFLPALHWFNTDLQEKNWGMVQFNRRVTVFLGILKPLPLEMWAF